MARPAIPLNRVSMPEDSNLDHESFVDRVHQAIDATRHQHGEYALAPVENNMLRVYEFDSWVTNGGTDSYFAHVDHRQDRQDAVNALAAVNLANVAQILIDAELQYFRSCDGDDEDHLKKMDEFDQAYFALKVDMSEVLTHYLKSHYPWL